jgi:hypothetical protein
VVSGVILPHELKKHTIMKTRIITTTILVLALSLTVLADGKKESAPVTTSNVTVKDCQFCINEYRNNIIEFRMVKENDEKITLKIYNDKGVKLFHRNFRKANGFELDCDLSNLRNGNYTFVVEKDNQEILRKVFQK